MKEQEARALATTINTTEPDITAIPERTTQRQNWRVRATFKQSRILTAATMQEWEEIKMMWGLLPDMEEIA